MPFIGKNPTSGFSTIVKDDLTADGSTTAFTLSKQVASANDVAVFVGNVRQEPTDAYSVNGTTLTMTAAPASGINFYVLHIAGTLESSVVPADDTISTAKIQSSAVTDAKISGMSSSKLTGALPALDGSALTGAGKLLNVYNNRINTDLEVGNNTRYQWTQSQITVTPVSTNSRFWLFLTTFSASTSSATTGNLGLYRLSGGSYGTVTEIPEGTWQHRLYNARNSFDAAQVLSFQYYDSPSTTDSIRYVFYLERNSGGDSVWIGNTSTVRPSYLTIFEFDSTAITTGSDGI